MEGPPECNSDYVSADDPKKQGKKYVRKNVTAGGELGLQRDMNQSQKKLTELWSKPVGNAKTQKELTMVRLLGSKSFQTTR